MAYDCIDGWSDIIEALQLDLNAEGIDADDPQEVATLALDRIGELQRAETAARGLLAALRDACASIELQASTYEHRAHVENHVSNLGVASELQRNARAYRVFIAKAEAAGIKV